MANEEFYVGQIFEGLYPPAAATACNQNGWFMDVIGEKRYQIKEVPAPSEEEIKQRRISELKAELSSTDYVVIKIAEADTTEEQQQLREHYADVIANRKMWRTEINTLESEE